MIIHAKLHTVGQNSYWKQTDVRQTTNSKIINHLCGKQIIKLCNAWIHFALWWSIGLSYTYSPEAAVVRFLFCRPLYCPKSSETLQTASRAFSLKREEEEIAEEAEDNEANDPVDGVYIDDHHVHVKSPAMRIILKVEGIKSVAPVRELPSANWTCLPLKA